MHAYVHMRINDISITGARVTSQRMLMSLAGFKIAMEGGEQELKRLRCKVIPPLLTQ